MLLSSVASVLLMHAKFGASALESLAALGATDPKLGLPLLLLILYYIKMLSSNDINTSEMLVSNQYCLFKLHLTPENQYRSSEVYCCKDMPENKVV